MDGETTEAILDLHAEIRALQFLLFGLSMSLKNRNLGQDILRETFDRAEVFAEGGVFNPDFGGGISDASARTLKVLLSLREALLASPDAPHV